MDMAFSGQHLRFYGMAFWIISIYSLWIDKLTINQLVFPLQNTLHAPLDRSAAEG